ncbi:MAG: hypothetical protein V3U33_04335 [candidate division NC10 bacterium]
MNCTWSSSLGRFSSLIVFDLAEMWLIIFGATSMQKAGSSDSRSPYVYSAQKDRRDLEEPYAFLVSLGIEVGKMHNPSRRVDPDYWRFYIRRRSLRRFSDLVGSWHPRKSKLLKRTGKATAFEGL